MSWEQHRYAVERARDRMSELNTKILEESQMVSLQSEAAGSDAELLDEVVDFLRSLEGSNSVERIENPGPAFVGDWNKTIAEISVFCDRWRLPKPDMLFHPQWKRHMEAVAAQALGSPIIYCGVRVRFGTYQSMDVLKPA